MCVCVYVCVLYLDLMDLLGFVDLFSFVVVTLIYFFSTVELQRRKIGFITCYQKS